MQRDHMTDKMKENFKKIYGEGYDDMNTRMKNEVMKDYVKPGCWSEGTAQVSVENHGYGNLSVTEIKHTDEWIDRNVRGYIKRLHTSKPIFTIKNHHYSDKNIIQFFKINGVNLYSVLYEEEFFIYKLLSNTVASYATGFAYIKPELLYKFAYFIVTNSTFGSTVHGEQGAKMYEKTEDRLLTVLDAKKNKSCAKSLMVKEIVNLINIREGLSGKFYRERKNNSMFNDIMRGIFGLYEHDAYEQYEHNRCIVSRQYFEKIISDFVLNNDLENKKGK